MESRQDLELVQKILNQYTMKVKGIEHIPDRQFPIYKIIDEKDLSFYLCIYQPNYGKPDINLINGVSLNSMMLWLDNLTKTPNLKVQTPVMNRMGDYVTEVEGINSILVEWLDGKNEPFVTSEEFAGQIGSMIGHLHKSASQWVVPENFKRPDYNSVQLLTMLERLENSKGFDFNPSNVSVIIKSAEKVIRLLDEIEKTNLNWGLVHCDIVPANILIMDSSLQLIDFGACKFGYYLCDLGYIMEFTPLPFRQTMFSAYSEVFNLPENYVNLIEAFYVMTQLVSMRGPLTMPETRDWLPRYLNKLAEGECLWFLNDENHLFTKKSRWK